MPHSALLLKAFTSTPNAGDAAGPEIVSHLVGREVETIGNGKSDLPHLLALGSILEWADSNSVIWGTGLIDARAQLTSEARAAKFFAVRGPLTYDILTQQGCTCPKVLGDPGVLISEIFPRIETQGHGIGMIPHYIERDEPFVREAHEQGAEIIDPGVPLSDYIAAMQKKEVIISSSLHGIIFAHAYGIPACWIRLTDRVIGGGFKFHDYYRSIGFKESEIPMPESRDRLTSIASMATLPRQEIDTTALKQALIDAHDFLLDAAP